MIVASLGVASGTFGFSSIFLHAGDSSAGLVFISWLEQGPSPGHATWNTKSHPTFCHPDFFQVTPALLINQGGIFSALSPASLA